MSSSTSASLAPNHLANLLLILRRANMHYERVADEIRSSSRPTHHARKCAQRLQLSVDIEKAVNCPQRQISNIPPPVIDASPSPTALSVPLAFQARSREPSPAPARVHVRPLVRPIVIHAPTLLPQQNVPWRGLTSRFSTTPTDARLPTKEDLKLTEVEIAAREQERVRAERDWVLPDVPVDMVDYTWELPEDALVSSAQSSVPSEDSSSSVSSGPTTPVSLFRRRLRPCFNRIKFSSRLTCSQLRCA